MSDIAIAESAGGVRDQSAFSWSAALAGGFTTAALTLLLLAFGAGMGFSSVSPWSNSGVSATTFSTAAGIYLLVVAMLSSTIGGYMAGRLRTKWVGIHSPEVQFRDTAHGLVAWAFATVLSAAALGAAATSIVGGAASSPGPGAASASGTQPATSPANSYYVDMLLRPKPGAAPPAATPETPALRREVGVIFGHSVLRGEDLPAGDRAYLTQVITARTGLSQAEAEKRIADVTMAAKMTLDEARRTAAKLSLWLTAAMLLGAFAASLAAIEGGQLRDGRWRGVIGTRAYLASTQHIT